MGYAEASRVIHAPVEVVWNCLNDIDHTPEWVVGLNAAEIVTPGEFGEGSIYVDHNQLGPFPQVTPWHITAFEPMTYQVHESKSAVLPSKMTLNLSPDAAGARLKMSVEYRLMPRWGAVSRLLETLLMNRMLGQIIGQNQAHLDTYLQSRKNS